MPTTVWKGFISFGLVSFPVKLFAAARAGAAHFHMLHKKDLSRVKEVWYCAAENKPIERTEIVKGYETGKGQYVVVEDEELKKIAPPTATTMDILQFVGRDEVDAIFFESSYYVAPGESGTKPYALFLAALTNTKQAAIAKMAIRNREHIVLIRPFEKGLVLHTLFYQNELHQAKRAEAPKAPYTTKELDLAKSLINHLRAPFEPGHFEDTYRGNVERLVEQKRKGQKITTAEKPRTAPVIDLMDALRRSLEAGQGSKSRAKGGPRNSPRKAGNRRRAA